MANFTKKQTRKLIEASETGSDSLFRLADEQKAEILTIYKKRSYATAYGAGVPVQSIARGSVTYVLNSGSMTPKKKTKLGAEIDYELTGFLPKTVYLSESEILSGGFEEQDLMAGMKEATVIKMTQALNTFDTVAERGFLKTLGTFSPTPTSATAPANAAKMIDITALTTKEKVMEAKDAIVDTAFELAEIVDSKFALDGIEESRIFIDLSSKLFNRLVREDVIVDEADATFKDGIFRIGTMGGFKVRRNEFLGKAGIIAKAWDGSAKDKIIHAIVATDLTAVSPRQVVAANGGKLKDLSEDEGYYVEQKFASKDGKSTDYAVQAITPLLRLFVAK